MSRKPSFANLRTHASATPVDAQAAPAADGAGEGAAPPGHGAKPPIPPSRAGRKQIAGFFSPDMSFALHMLARRQGRNLQALMTEAFDDVLRKHGESPVGG